MESRSSDTLPSGEKVREVFKFHPNFRAIPWIADIQSELPDHKRIDCLEYLTNPVVVSVRDYFPNNVVSSPRLYTVGLLRDTDYIVLYPFYPAQLLIPHLSTLVNGQETVRALSRGRKFEYIREFLPKGRLRDIDPSKEINLQTLMHPEYLSLHNNKS